MGESHSRFDTMQVELSRSKNSSPAQEKKQVKLRDLITLLLKIILHAIYAEKTTTTRFDGYDL